MSALDLTGFNSPNGFINTNFGFPSSTINTCRAVALQTDGKIVMAGDSENTGIKNIAISRYNTDGSLDTTFGTGGKVTVQLGSASVLTYGLSIQSDGKIVVCGETSPLGFQEMFVARFTTIGILDTANFNTPFGYILITPSDFTTAYNPLTFDNCYANNLEIDTTTTPNKIVVVGTVRRTGSPNRYYIAMARLKLDGTLDNISFGVNGLVAQSFNPVDEYANSLSITTSGDYILVGNEIVSATNISFSVSKFDTTGLPVAAFGTSGIVIVPHFFTNSTDAAASIKIQQDGKIIVGGTSTKSNLTDNCFAIARLDSTTGILDTTFGINGQVITDLSPTINLSGSSLAIQNDGKIVLGGTFTNNISNGISFALARYSNINGSLDTTFGINNNGLILEDLVNGVSELGNSIAIQTDGKIIVGGTEDLSSDISEIKYFILARYFGFPPFPPPIPIGPIPIVPICFPAGTPVFTDQGYIPIEQINPELNTIRNKPIIAITKTTTNHDKIVCFEKHSLGYNVPNNRTFVSLNHGIIYNKKLIPAKNFVGKKNDIYFKKYNGEYLYNVLMEKHMGMLVNGMKVETLDPKNIIAKLYTKKYSPAKIEKTILKINNYSYHYYNNYSNFNNYERLQYNN